MPAPTIVWSEATPREPGGGPECGLSCRGIWRELRDEIGHPGRRGWGWECDKRGCPHGSARSNPQREEGRDAAR
jgi:hypothetical protein